MSFLRSNESGDATQSIEDEIAGIGLQQVDEASAVPRPASVGHLHVEEETEFLADEQAFHWQADGLVEARPLESVIGELDNQVADLESRLARHRHVVDEAKERMERTILGLGHHVRRPHDAAKLFYLRMALIFLGDIVGVAASLINFGLVVWMAVVQGVALGGAVMALGSAGLEWKHLQRQRDLQRPIDELREDETPFAQVFAGPRAGESYAKIGIYVAAAALLLIFGGVLAVQSATDGLAAGVFFGCLGAAVGFASAVNYWSYGDPVADVVNNAKAGFAKADAELHSLSDDEVRRAHGKATAELQSIQQEYELRGQAARVHMLALGKRVLRTNPGVAGHGQASKASQLGRAHSNGHDSKRKVGS